MPPKVSKKRTRAEANLQGPVVVENKVSSSTSSTSGSSSNVSRSLPIEVKDDLKYLNGFGNHLESEALPEALPKRGFTPQK